ncbi:MAG: malate dehydrogenase, partial [Bacteroidota bacterium]
WYAPGAAAAQMVEAILKDENRIFPCCARLNGQYGLKDMFLGVPVKLNRNGIGEILELKLNKSETKLLHKSAAHVQAVMETFNDMNIV